MKTITILSQKGGTGKTTIAAALSVEAEKNNIQTLVIDIDPQASITKWGERREAKTPFIISAQAERLEHLLNEAQKTGADWTVIDTPGKSGDAAALKAARLSDFVLIPTRPSAHDIHAISDSIDIALLAKKNPYVLLNAVPPNAGRLFDELRRVLEENYKVPVVPFYLAHRSAYMHSALTGQGAQEYDPAGKAADEIRRLLDWLRLMID
ncbi:MAG: AAA family ATPase [Candidatus Competibacteraceae bacterium]|nr:AAA family ATPase [Candidatus Competibacteraceae bacterium]